MQFSQLNTWEFKAPEQKGYERIGGRIEDILESDPKFP